jgi:hypothetical protein
MKRVLILSVLAAVAGVASAKLPPLSDEAKAKAAEAAAKAAHTGKVDTYKLCLSMDKVAARYLADAKKAGKDTKPPAATPPCSDPGPFVYTPPEQKPLEAAGAHSPPGAAASPPNTKTPAAASNPAKKT